MSRGAPESDAARSPRVSDEQAAQWATEARSILRGSLGALTNANLPQIILLCDDLLSTRADLAAAEKENEEQARLLGMGSEREAKLMAERDEALAEVERLRRILPPGGDRAEGGIGEGSWAVFAEKVVAERDEALAELQVQIENCQHCYAERIISEKYRAERDEARRAVKLLREMLAGISGDCYECPECGAFKPERAGLGHEKGCALVALLTSTAAIPDPEEKA